MTDGDTLRLVAASEAHAASYIDALREGYRRGIQPARSAEEIDGIERDFLAHLTDSAIPPREIRTPDGQVFAPVAATEFWAVEAGGFVGSISCRFTLNAMLERFGGHIGYGVRPRLQGRGYATRIVGLAKALYRARGDDRLLVSCAPDNIASKRVIEKSGGVLLRREENPFGLGPVLMFEIGLG